MLIRKSQYDTLLREHVKLQGKYVRQEGELTSALMELRSSKKLSEILSRETPQERSTRLSLVSGLTEEEANSIIAVVGKSYYMTTDMHEFALACLRFAYVVKGKTL